jgi:hypothetical protein
MIVAGIPSVENLIVASAAISFGGSSASASVTPPSLIVTVQVSSRAKSVWGSSV